MVKRTFSRQQEHKAAVLRNEDSLLQLVVHRWVDHCKGQDYFMIVQDLHACPLRQLSCKEPD